MSGSCPPVCVYARGMGVSIFLICLHMGCLLVLVLLLWHSVVRLPPAFHPFWSEVPRLCCHTLGGGGLPMYKGVAKYQHHDM